MIEIIVSYDEFKNEVLSKSLSHFCYSPNGNTELVAIDASVAFKHTLDDDNIPDYETTLLPTANKKIGNYNSSEPFSTKVLQDGKKLYRRKHGNIFNAVAESTSIHDFVIPYPHCKIDKIEIINCAVLDTVNLKVIDTAEGAYSTVPNYTLNQFGFDTVMTEGYYIDESHYEADLYLGMILRVEYSSNVTVNKTIGLNLVLHEVV